MFDVMMMSVFLKSTTFAVGVRQLAVLEDLEEEVRDVRVRLLDLVEEDQGVGLAPDALRELAALLVSDVARGRADQLGDGVLLHVLGHVEAHERLLVVEQELRERRATSVFPTPEGPRKMNEPIGRFGFLTPSRERRIARLIAPIERSCPITRFLQRLLHVKELLGLLHLERRDGDARPARDDLLDVARVTSTAFTSSWETVFVRSISSLSSISRSRRNTARSKSFSEIAFFISLTICP
jgi:hypothetical protein